MYKKNGSSLSNLHKLRCVCREKKRLLQATQLYCDQGACVTKQNDWWRRSTSSLTHRPAPATLVTTGIILSYGPSQRLGVSYGTNAPCHTYQCVMPHLWMSHVTHMNDSCHIFEWVVSHTWTYLDPRGNRDNFSLSVSLSIWYVYIYMCIYIYIHIYIYMYVYVYGCVCVCPRSRWWSSGVLFFISYLFCYSFHLGCFLFFFFPSPPLFLITYGVMSA